jgi:hypothetical protein
MPAPYCGLAPTLWPRTYIVATPQYCGLVASHLSLSHTHTHTHSLSLSLSLSRSLSLALSHTLMTSRSSLRTSHSMRGLQLIWWSVIAIAAPARLLTSAYGRTLSPSTKICSCSLVAIAAPLQSLHTSANGSIRQHISASVSNRQHTSAYVSINRRTTAHVSIRLNTSGYHSIRQHTSADVLFP